MSILVRKGGNRPLLRSVRHLHRHSAEPPRTANVMFVWGRCFPVTGTAANLPSHTRAGSSRSTFCVRASSGIFSVYMVISLICFAMVNSVRFIWTTIFSTMQRSAPCACAGSPRSAPIIPTALCAVACAKSLSTPTDYVHQHSEEVSPSGSYSDALVWLGQAW